MSYFMSTVPNIEGNKKLRQPQIEAYAKICSYFSENPSGEALVVLPTGTGKSGLISIAPFRNCNKRVLVITPGLVTKKSVVKALHPLEENFWIKYDVLLSPEDIPVVEEYEPDMLQSSLESCDIVIANVHKLYRSSSRSLLNAVPQDFFDMVIVDEAHHSVANTWKDALEYFKDAKKLHVTGTPYRGDNIEVPGTKIHSTPLSEAMACHYVKLLRKATINSNNMYFTMPGDPTKYTKEQIIELKDKEWIEKSVALSKECSMDVIQESINKLDQLKSLSPAVHHKILAVACSISHANDVAGWYESKGKTVVVVHSDMPQDEVDRRLLMIENDECEVVVSVNILMEGYDHKYLTVLALFRPYRSKNAFAQIIGRVLRAIPGEEITDYAIDNNAFVIYHEETGLDSLWREFADEVEKSHKHSSREYDFNDREYKERESLYADIDTDEYHLSPIDSYLPDIDFNELFENARRSIEQYVDEKIKKFLDSGVSDETAKEIRKVLKKSATQEKKSEIDSILVAKRPEQARRMMRDILFKDANEAAQSLLDEKSIDAKSSTLYHKFRFLHQITPQTCNDGILVIYINSRLSRKFGPVKERTPDKLVASQKYMLDVVEELRRMI